MCVHFVILIFLFYFMYASALTTAYDSTCVTCMFLSSVLSWLNLSVFVQFNSGDTPTNTFLNAVPEQKFETFTFLVQ